MAKKNYIILVCSNCKNENYISKKNDTIVSDIKKYCSKCHRHTVHKVKK